MNGLVGIRRVQNSQWRSAYHEVEAISSEFLALFGDWGSGYPWPADPLRWWFRPFEYPYVLQNLPPVDGPRRPLVVDVGAAVTFFSLLLVQRGYVVKCADSDPRMLDFWHRLKASVPSKWREDVSRIEYRISEIPFPAGMADAVTCISVLEHVSHPPKLLREMLRILKPGGVLVLTMDVSLDSNLGVSAENFNEMCALLDVECAPVHPVESVHPQELLVWPDTPRGLVPAAWKPPGGFKGWLAAQAGQLRRYWSIRAPSRRSLCLFVGTYVKRGGK
jgi:SAM-dependent methyltransferase